MSRDVTSRDTAIYRIASEYVDAYATLHPLVATAIGVPGHDDGMTDFSPAGAAERARLARETLDSLAAAPVEDERDRVAREVMEERLRLAVQLYETDDDLRAVAVLGSPLQMVRQVFDVAARDTAEAWRDITRRMERVPEGLAGLRASLEEGMARGIRATKRQAEASAMQAEAWSGRYQEQGGPPPFFGTLVAAFDEAGIDDDTLRDELAAAAVTANEAYADIAEYLRQRYAPQAEEHDPVGADRYRLYAQTFSGAELDLEDTYRWGWGEVERLDREIRATAERIAPGKSLTEVRELLESDPERAIEGEEAFRQWMQDLQDRMIAELDGTHFDIPEPVRRVEAMIAPPGGALAMYYTGPSEDFSRPGRTWYPTGGKTRFPLWSEVSVAYHEGVPGHHLQIAMTKYLADELSRYQRLLGGNSGYVEGWGLYAERLMAELGYLDNPDYYLGMLTSQVFRAARVVVDIGMHLELEVPSEGEMLEAFPHAGERWTPALAREFMLPRNPFNEAFVDSEIDRYLGIPGQAISYKVGERYWLEAREAARQSAGDAFDLKAWHQHALSLGPLGLDQMRRELGGQAS